MVAGIVLVRQRPGTAKGVVFLTIEDETGIANIIVWKKVFEANRRIAMQGRFLAVRGRVQRAGEVVHLVAEGFATSPNPCGTCGKPGCVYRRRPPISGRRHTGNPIAAATSTKHQRWADSSSGSSGAFEGLRGDPLEMLALKTLLGPELLDALAVLREGEPVNRLFGGLLGHISLLWREG